MDTVVTFGFDISSNRLTLKDQLSSMGELMHWKRSSSVSHYRAVGTWGQGDGINPISSRGQIMPITLLFLPPPRIFRVSYGPALQYPTSYPMF